MNSMLYCLMNEINTGSGKGGHQNSGGCNCDCLQPFAKGGNIILLIMADLNNQNLMYIVSI